MKICWFAIAALFFSSCSSESSTKSEEAAITHDCEDNILKVMPNIKPDGIPTVCGCVGKVAAQYGGTSNFAEYAKCKGTAQSLSLDDSPSVPSFSADSGCSAIKIPDASKKDQASTDMLKCILTTAASSGTTGTTSQAPANSNSTGNTTGVTSGASASGSVATNTTGTTATGTTTGISSVPAPKGLWTKSEVAELWSSCIVSQRARGNSAKAESACTCAANKIMTVHTSYKSAVSDVSIKQKTAAALTECGGIPAST